MSSYIGRGIDKISNVEKLDNISFSGSTATFNLTKGGTAFIPSSAECIRLAIDGIEQGNNYTVSGSQITFDFTPSGSSTNNWIYHIGVGVITTPGDGTVTEAKIGSSAVTTAKINDGAVTSGKIASGVIPDAVTLRPNANPLIINGDMAVAQRGTSVSGASSSGYKAIDRYRHTISIGTWTISQSTDTPSGEGFLNSMKMDCTTAEASPGSSDTLILQQKIEPQNLILLKKGTSNAEKITIAFWIKATKTGTNILELFDNNNNRQVSKAYTISSSDTWEKKVINFPADTTGVLANNNNSFNVSFYLGAGSNFTSGTLNTSWSGYVNSNRAVGQVNHGDSTSNNFYITGIQLEVGEYSSTTIPPFQHESFGDNLIRCQRYFQTLDNQSGQMYSSGTGRIHSTLSPRMRTSPSQSTSASLSNSVEDVGVANLTPSSISLASSSTDHIAFNTNGLSSTTRNMILLKIKMEISAEL